MHQQSIAGNVRRLREERHWSQEELAAASEVDVRTIQRAEAGKPLQVESLRAIAAAFNTTIEQLSVSEEGIKAFIEEFKKTHRIIELRPVTNAADVTGFFGAEAYYLHKGGTLSEEQVTRSRPSSRTFTTGETSGVTSALSSGETQKRLWAPRSSTSPPME